MRMTAQPRKAAHADDGHVAFSASTHWTPPPATLDNLEMLLLGAYRPLTGFLGQREAALVAAERRLEDDALATSRRPRGAPRHRRHSCRDRDAPPHR